MTMHAFARFEPRPGAEARLREALHEVVLPSRAEAGCVQIELFETLRAPPFFEIHSEWADEAAFELHADLPHTVRFLAAVPELLTHELRVLRTEQIG
jgi:quinol monooxygenase YgiN